MINEICYDELKNMFNREIGDINLPEIKLENGYLGSRLECEVMAKLCKLQKPKKIFEIGTFEGGTTLIMAMNSPEAEIYTLDLPWINQPDRKEEIGNSNQFYIDNRKKIVFEDTHYAKRVVKSFGDFLGGDYGRNEREYHQLDRFEIYLNNGSREKDSKAYDSLFYDFAI